jgi:hypothetical protein
MISVHKACTGRNVHITIRLIGFWLAKILRVGPVSVSSPIDDWVIDDFFVRGLPETVPSQPGPRPGSEIFAF